MKRPIKCSTRRSGRTRLSLGITVFLAAALALPCDALAYTTATTVPQAGGCPQLNRFSLSPSAPLNRRWSTALPTTMNPVIITSAAQNSPAALTEIEQAITASFSTWSGVTGTNFNSASYPGSEAPLTRVSAANSCTNDADTNVDGLNTICFNQSSAGFTTGVLAFTRTFTANAPGATVGPSAPALFAGQILDSDTLFRNDGQATFATPPALATQAGAGAYDLQSLLTHELGHWMGLGHSAVIRAMMFPYAPVPGSYLGDRPTVAAPDGPLSDDDRTGIRALYPDPNDTMNAGSLRGQITPANPFALALQSSPAAGSFVTGIVGAHVVAIDTSTGSVVAGALSGWSCSPSVGAVRWDGTFLIDRLPVNHSYSLYAEPLINIAQPADFSNIFADPCGSSSSTCSPPTANTNFNVTLH
jgi:Matrixin